MWHFFGRLKKMHPFMRMMEIFYLASKTENSAIKNVMTITTHDIFQSFSPAIFTFNVEH